MSRNILITCKSRNILALIQMKNAFFLSFFLLDFRASITVYLALSKKKQEAKEKKTETINTQFSCKDCDFHSPLWNIKKH